jgi:hypothetical protein
MKTTAQEIGVTTFCLAAALCLAAAVVARGSVRKSGARWFWGVAATLQVLYAIEVVAVWRFDLGNFFRGLVSRGAMPAKDATQAAGFWAVLLLAVVIAVFVGVLMRRRGVPTGLAVAGCLWAPLVFALESVSSDPIENFLYQKLGPSMTVGWLWMMAGLLVALGAALRLVRRGPPTDPATPAA